jgi:hypothetical protein
MKPFCATCLTHQPWPHPPRGRSDEMSLRILHVLDHSLPLHSGYSFRTLAILREQRALGWQTLI